MAPRTDEFSASPARRTTSPYHAGKSLDWLGKAVVLMAFSFVDVDRRRRSRLRRSEPKRRERLRPDVHERRPRGNRRNRQKLIHARPQQRHAQRIAGSAILNLMVQYSGTVDRAFA